MTDADLITRLIRDREGSTFTHGATDRGGPTKYGITKQTLAEWRGRAVTTSEVMALAEAEARQIYAAMYLAPWAGIDDPVVREQLFDCGVLHGVGRAKRWLQMALAVEADGVIGPVTLAAYRRANLVDVQKALIRQRLDFIGSIVQQQPALHLDDLRGWLRRVGGLL